MDTQTVERKRTYCRICTVHCGIVADVAGEKIVKISGDREHPITKGYTCPKGRATDRMHHHPDAITRPMMRKDGELVAVSWDEALDDIAEKLRAIIDAHGPRVVGLNFGSGLGLDSSGYAMEEALQKELQYPPKFSPLTIDGTSKVMISGAMGSFPGLNPKTDYDNVEMLIYVGTNPMVSHGHNTGMYQPADFIRAAAARGEVWTIDPLLTETAKWSTRHIAAYPGKDYAVLAWLVREIIDNGLMDLQQPVSGLDELRGALEGYTRAKAADIAGVPERDLEDLLDAVRRKRRVAVETGTGVTMSAGCNLTQWFAWTIMVLTGAMNRKGGAWFHPGFLNQFEKFELPVMDSWTPGPMARPEVLGVIGDTPCAVLPEEIDAGNIRALMNFGGSLMRSFPDTSVLETALKKLALNVTFEIIANETTALSTHVLPTKDPVERAEIQRWDTLAWTVSMQFTPALVKPMGERRSAWWVISQIMKRANIPVPADVPEDDQQQGADERMLARQFPYARCSFEEIKAKRVIEFPLEFPGAWVDAHIERIGGWKLAHPHLVKQWTEMRAADEAALGKPKPLVYTARRQRKKLNAQLDFLGAAAEVILHPDDAASWGIADGEKVRVRNESGAIELTAKVDPGMRRGVVSIPHGHTHANVNRLTSTKTIDPLGGMAFYSGVPIAIERIPSAA
jgi:anaerobic selenocysteine-containing dehydrogenase